MSKAAHTPTPWAFKVFEDTEQDNFYLGPYNCEDGQIEHTILEGGLVLSDEQNLANAEFIVRAVNAHEALVDACEEFVRNAEDGEVRIERSCAQMSAALKLARGEQ